MRLDLALVERNLAPSRTKARALIVSSCVVVNGTVVDKPSVNICGNDDIHLLESNVLKYVSRGGLKLEKALDAFEIHVAGLNALDIGSSTGGFTDCLLQNGASHVNSVDVGTDCMNPQLAADPRVSLYEQTDIRTAPSECFEDIDIVVCDASFVSLSFLLKDIADKLPHAQFILLIKPQFECGAEIAKKYKGVIKDKSVHQSIVPKVIGELSELGLVARKLCLSPIEGGDGNKEYLVLLDKQPGGLVLSAEEIEAVVKQAFV